MSEKTGEFSVDESMERKNSSRAWERDVLEKVALAAITEQRKTRFWNIFFKFLLFAYLIALFFVLARPFESKSLASVNGHTAIINIKGMIMEGGETSADNIIKGLQAAVEDSNTRGIILKMNSPGGSPVQSAYIYDEIRRIRGERPDLPIYAVVSDICASGGYYIAAAADKIFVNSSSLVGSIGVLMNGFGFVDTLKKLGVERRLMTAGEHKGFMDPFLPMGPEEKAYVQTMLKGIHQQFIKSVREGRGDRLKDNPDIFSGLVWSGDEGIKLGLVDALGTTNSVARDQIGAEELVDFTPKEHILDRLVTRMGTAFGNAIGSSLLSYGMR
ncbi:MAG: signal peptide peptidase SppA [Methylococcales bacterium]